MKTEFSHYTVYFDGGDTVEHNVARLMTSGSLVVLEDEDRDPVAVYAADRFYYAQPTYAAADAKSKDSFGSRLVGIMTHGNKGDDGDEQYNGCGEIPPLDVSKLKAVAKQPLDEINVSMFGDGNVNAMAIRPVGTPADDMQEAIDQELDRQDAVTSDWAWILPGGEHEGPGRWWSTPEDHGVTGFDVTMAEKKNRSQLLPPDNDANLESWKRVNENLKAASQNAA